MFYNKGIQEDDAIWTILEVWIGFFQELEGNIIKAFLKNNKEKKQNNKGSDPLGEADFLELGRKNQRRERKMGERRRQTFFFY